MLQLSSVARQMHWLLLLVVQEKLFMLSTAKSLSYLREMYCCISDILAVRHSPKGRFCSIPQRVHKLILKWSESSCLEHGERREAELQFSVSNTPRSQLQSWSWNPGVWEESCDSAVAPGSSDHVTCFSIQFHQLGRNFREVLLGAHQSKCSSLT